MNQHPSTWNHDWQVMSTSPLLSALLTVYIDVLLLKSHFNFMKFKCLKSGNTIFMATFPSRYS